MNSKVELDIRTIIIIILIIIMVRTTISCYPTVEPRLEECAYGYLVKGMEVSSVTDIEATVESNQEKQLYYIGRGSCTDCRDIIKKVLIINEMIVANSDISIEYVPLKNEITAEERAYLDSINVDEIPVIILIERGNITSFGYYDFLSEKYKNNFKKFIGG